MIDRDTLLEAVRKSSVVALLLLSMYAAEIVLDDNIEFLDSPELAVEV